MTLDELKIMFPPKAGTCSVTGYLPMDFVNENLPALAALVKEHGLKRRYRGPRYDGMRQHTRRSDAYAMVLYNK